MNEIILISKIIGGIVIVFSVGWVIGCLLKLDKAHEEMLKSMIDKE